MSGPINQQEESQQKCDAAALYLFKILFFYVLETTKYLNVK